MRSCFLVLLFFFIRTPLFTPTLYFQSRDALICHTPRDLEPILCARRHILRSLDRPKKEFKVGLTKLLVQSCRLARENDINHVILPFLTEAKKHGSPSLDLEIERANYYYEMKVSLTKVDVNLIIVRWITYI